VWQQSPRGYHMSAGRSRAMLVLNADLGYVDLLSLMLCRVRMSRRNLSCD